MAKAKAKANVAKVSRNARTTGKAKASKANVETKARKAKAIASKTEAKASAKRAKAKVDAKREAAKATRQVNKGSGIELADNMRIKLNVRENPKRKGTASYQRFQLYFTKKPKTVADAIEAGIWRADLRWDAARNFIDLQ